MNGEEVEKEAVAYWWEKAERSISAAQRELEAGAHGFAVNRLYYALFYAVSAALLERGQTYRKHSGVRSAFHREFIKPGELDTEWGQLYDELFEDRNEADYVEFVEFDRQYVRRQLRRCREFLENLRPLIRSLTG